VSATFDVAAPTYDATFTDTRLGQWLRDRVWEVLGDVFQAGDRVLEIGCGTGEDAVWLARRGVSVVATDVSSGMRLRAEAKVAAAGLRDHVTVAESAEGVFDGALADFGVLNCFSDRRAFAADLAEKVRPGGVVVLGVMAPLCAWEIVWHVAHLQPRTAFRRLAAGRAAHVGGGVFQPVWYPSPRQLRREMEPHFAHRQVDGIGTVLPPSYLSHLADGWPAWTSRLDRAIGTLPFGPWLADHYLAVFERR
jgi:cyclopropane fatty-acyl-phospholipid synthase-like methyltransferase